MQQWRTAAGAGERRYVRIHQQTGSVLVGGGTVLVGKVRIELVVGARMRLELVELRMRRKAIVVGAAIVGRGKATSMATPVVLVAAVWITIVGGLCYAIEGVCKIKWLYMRCSCFCMYNKLNNRTIRVIALHMVLRVQSLVALVRVLRFHFGQSQ